MVRLDRRRARRSSAPSPPQRTPFDRNLADEEQKGKRKGKEEKKRKRKKLGRGEKGEQEGENERKGEEEAGEWKMSMEGNKLNAVVVHSYA